MSHFDLKVKGSIGFGRGGGFGSLQVGADDNILTAAAAEALGVKWSPASVTGGGTFIFYGDGGDGDATLVADVVLAVNDNVKRYNNLTQAGFDLTHNTTNFYIFVMVKNTWTPGGGFIQGALYSTGGVGGGVVGQTGRGGKGGDGRHAVFVLARVSVGTGIVNASGGAGLNGLDGVGQGNGGVGKGGAPSAIGNYAFGNADPNATLGSSPVFPGAPGSALGGGGAATTGGLLNKASTLRSFRNALGCLFLSPNSFNIGGGEIAQPWAFAAMGAQGGGQGAPGSNDWGGGGGAGAPGTGFYGAGGNGGQGGQGDNNAGATGTGDGGGGGGAGSGGCFAFFMGSIVSSGITVTSQGGAGGDGGDASTATPPFFGGDGGGGGGGGGGVAIGIAPAGVGYTVIATGGAGGLAGTAGASGATNGSGGGAGLAMAIPST